MVHRPGDAVTSKKDIMWPERAVKDLPCVDGRVDGLFVVKEARVERDGADVNAYVLRHIQHSDFIYSRRISAVKKGTALTAAQKALSDELRAAGEAAQAAATMAAAAVAAAVNDGSANGEEDPDAPPSEENDPADAPKEGDVSLINRWGVSTAYLGLKDMYDKPARFIGGQPLPPSPGQHFVHFLPPTLLSDMVASSNTASANLLLTRDELLQYIGLIMLSATVDGSKENMWRRAGQKWRPSVPVEDVMSLRRFREINAHLTVSGLNDPLDPFVKGRKMVSDWNSHMKSIFSPGRVSCLDESMVSFQTADHDFPGSTFCARKPHPEGNMYHSICDGDTGIMYHIELQEGEQRPDHHLPPPYQEEFGNMGGLMLRMTESIKHTNRVVVMDSAFSITPALLEMRKRHIHSTVVVKKKGASGWPSYLDGNAILEHMKNKPVGEVHTAFGVLESMEFMLYAVNHNKFTYMNLATYGTSNPESRDYVIANEDGTSFSFKRPPTLVDHYEVRPKVDTHNRYRQGTHLSLESAWASKSWINRQIAFIMAISLVNAFLAYRHTHKGTKLAYNDFYYAVMSQLLNGNADKDQDACPEDVPPAKAAPVEAHVLTKAPTHADSKGTNKSRSKYQQVRCKGKQGCDQKIREHCSCNPTLFLCTMCFARHFHEQKLAEQAAAVAP